MNITYNNLSSPELLVTFTDIPNILKVIDDDYGSKATYTLTFVGNLYGETTADSQWYITLFGDTISNVLDSNNAVNKAFYVSTANTATAASVARALRNCPNLAANFTVEHNGTSVVVKARDNGSIFQGNYFESNINQAYMGRIGTDGYSNSQLQGALIDVDVYSNGEYLTTLEKNWYNGEAAFDMSPVLTTIAEIGKTVPYEFKVSSLKDGGYSVLGNIENNYISVGYMVNQGYKYLVLGEMVIAENVSRGASRDVENNMLLYTYANRIPVSFYCHNLGGLNYTVTYLDSAYNTITATTDSWRNTDSSQKLKQIDFVLDPTYFNQAFYIDITLGSTTTLRYNVIKPLKATEYWQRICWRNSYGGVSFFDFTGQRSETRNLELSTYQKNIFGYYDNEKNELNKSYDNKVEYTVTLKSHLFEHDGKYIFNDLLQSSDVWTEINGETYGILIDSVSVEEQNQNNIYEATVRYKYSQEPSLL